MNHAEEHAADVQPAKGGGNFKPLESPLRGCGSSDANLIELSTSTEQTLLLLKRIKS